MKCGTRTAYFCLSSSWHFFCWAVDILKKVFSSWDLSRWLLSRWLLSRWLLSSWLPLTEDLLLIIWFILWNLMFKTSRCFELLNVSNYQTKWKFRIKWMFQTKQIQVTDINDETPIFELSSYLWSMSIDDTSPTWIRDFKVIYKIYRSINLSNISLYRSI